MVEPKHEQPAQIWMYLTYETAEALYKYLADQYISYEHHSKVIELVKILRQTLQKD